MLGACRPRVILGQQHDGCVAFLTGRVEQGGEHVTQSGWGKALQNMLSRRIDGGRARVQVAGKAAALWVTERRASVKRGRKAARGGLSQLIVSLSREWHPSAALPRQQIPLALGMHAHPRKCVPREAYS